MKRIVDYLAEELKQAEPVVDLLAQEENHLPGFDTNGVAIQQRSGLKAMSATAGR